MSRDPLDTPIFLNENLNIIVAKRFVLNANNLQQVYYTFDTGEEIYAADFNNDLVASKKNIYNLNTYNITSVIPIDNIDQMFFDKNGTLFMLVNSESSIYYK